MRHIENQDLQEKLRDIESLWGLSGELNSVIEFFLDILAEAVEYIAELEIQAKALTKTNEELQGVIENVMDMVTYYNTVHYMDKDGCFDHVSFAYDISKRIKEQTRNI